MPKLKTSFLFAAAVCACVCVCMCVMWIHKRHLLVDKRKKNPPLPLTPYSLQKILYHLCRLQIVKLVTRTLQLLGNHEMHVRNK